MSADCGNSKILIVSGTPIRVIFQNSVTNMLLFLAVFGKLLSINKTTEVCMKSISESIGNTGDQIVQLHVSTVTSE